MWKSEIIVLIITISVYGAVLETNGSIKFEEDGPGLERANSNAGPFENDQHLNPDYNLNYDDPTLDYKDYAKVKFNNDYSENVDYQDINVVTTNENKQIVFKGDPNTDGIEEKVISAVKFEVNNDEEALKPSDALAVSGRIAFYNKETDQKPDKKRRKRRRKPKYQSYPGPINPNLMYPSGDPGYGNIGPGSDPGGAGYPNEGYPSYSYPYPQYPGSVYPGQNHASAYPQPGSQSQGHPVQPGYPDGNSGYLPEHQNQGHPSLQHPELQGYYRPSRRPKSLATKALSALSEALTSIATNDDHQCVPRLLCEAAGGRASGSTSLLQSAAGLDPLLSMLSAYNGISTSPLFVFGRAVFLGMTSKGNTASCRYAYPQCPTDPEKLIHYLNNHNGGFFRFFNSPVPQQNQNVEQFYNQLAGQYGINEPNGNQQNLGHQNQYGLLQTDFNQNLYNGANNYGYGQNKYGVQQYKKEAIEDRIQNKPIFDTDDENIQTKPASYLIEDDLIKNNPKWLFPDEINNGNDIKYETKPSRVSKTVKFPEDNKQYAAIHKDYVRKVKNIIFPEYNTRIIRNYDTTTAVSLDDYVFDNKYNFYVKRPKVVAQRAIDDGANTVYIVRGNGDPNHPEIVKIRPGQYA